MRAIAIISVVAMHVNGQYFEMNLQTTFVNSLPPFKGGWVGVPMFFVLSGFLIGGQIWSEFLKSGTVKFSRFILRRGFRIWPLFYFILALFIVFQVSVFSLNGALSNLFFLSNYLGDDGPINGAWSLSTEEQFYILAPLFIIIANKFLKVKSLLAYRKILFGFLLLPILGRYISWKFLGLAGEFDLATFMNYIYRPIHTNCEGLIIGMLIANYVKDTSFKASKFFERRDLILFFALIIMALSFKSKVYFNITGVAIGFGALLWNILDDKRLVGRILSSSFWFPIAKTSFGVYLIHVPLVKFIFHTIPRETLVQFPQLAPIFILIITMIISIGLASILYIIIERPFINLRNKIWNNKKAISV